MIATRYPGPLGDRLVLPEPGRCEFRTRDERPAGSEVQEGRRERGPEVRIRCHVVDGIREEHRIEDPAETDRSHVSPDVFDVRIQPPREAEHRGADVDSRDSVPPLERGIDVSSAATEMEDRTDRESGVRAKEPSVLPRLFDVVLRGADDRPCPRKVAIQPPCIRSVRHRRDGKRTAP